MRYVEYRPAPDLRPWVDRYWALEDARPILAPQTVLPDGHPEWVVHLDQPFAGQGRCLAIGQMTGSVSIRPTGALRVFGIRFRPEGAHAFCPVDQSELAGKIVDLTGIAPRWSEEIAELDPVLATDSMLRRLRVQEPDPRISHSVDLLMSGAAVDATARACNWSPRQLERTILGRTGLSPKMLARVTRFQRAIRLRARGLEWASVAAQAGFSDQSHLVRDFRQFSGSAPSTLQGTELTDALIR